MSATFIAARGAGGAGAEVVEISGVGAQGDGLADGGRFVPLTLPGERVRARFDRARGELIEVLAASRDRVAPPCPHFGTCGGCALQHWSAAPCLAWKVERIRQALIRVGLEPAIPPPFVASPGSRRRLALHARREGRGAAVGFKERRSWRLAAIETCVIAQPALVAALPALRALALPFLEHRNSAPTLHVTASETGLDIDVTGVERRHGTLGGEKRLRVAAIARAADFARVSLAGETLFQDRPARVRMGGVAVDLPAGGFLQAVEAAERAMAAFIADQAADAQRIVDLYCGVGAFALPLAVSGPRRRMVRAADISAPAVAALRRAANEAGRAISAEARDLDRQPLLAAELKGCEVAVIDPPRAGAAAQFRQLAASAVPKVISVSCDLASFARDGEILGAAGFRLETVWPIDQFLWSPHIELVGVFTR